MREEEESFYSLISMCNLSADLDALKEIHFVARTTDRKMLLLAKEQQRQQIAESRIDSGDTEITYIDDINITTVRIKPNYLCASPNNMHYQ